MYQHTSNTDINAFVASVSDDFAKNYYIKPKYFDRYEVKRGLRNADGTGVMAGVTKIANVYGYTIVDAEKIPTPGQLIYRGIDIQDLINGFVSEDRFGFEEVAYLLLFGSLPTQEQLSEFNRIIAELRVLPENFTEDMIIKNPSRSVMNKLARSVLALYTYDDNADDTSIENMLRQSLELIARMPTIAAHAYSVKRHYFDNDSLFLHRPRDDMSIAENILYSIRKDTKFTQEEARLLDLCMVLHAEHGGGNNSAFACRVLSSTGTDTYSAISAAIGSLKGPKHGGANKKVMEMFRHIEAGVSNWNDDEEIKDYLKKILSGEVGDGSGLIYGMGHAIYTLSDPRAVLLKKFARSIAETKGMLHELELREAVERLTPEVMQEITGEERIMCANVDLYSGLVYQMLDIPEDMYTPLFAVSRIVGWCAHRIEEIMCNRIIRPAYKAVAKNAEYVPMSLRK